MKWIHVAYIILAWSLFMVFVIGIGTHEKNSLNYYDIDIDTVDDVSEFLRECKQTIALDCEKLLLDKIDYSFGENGGKDER